jgi:hypothetical protein
MYGGQFWFKLRERYGEETEGGTLDLQVIQREQPRNPCFQRKTTIAYTAAKNKRFDASADQTTLSAALGRRKQKAKG